MTIVVEEADFDNPADCGALIEIIDSYARGPGGQNAPLSEEAKANMCRGLAAQANMTVLLASLSGRKVGAAVCIWAFSTFAGKLMFNIHDLAVLPELRGQGVGRALMSDVERRARDADCCKVSLEVFDSNEGAKRLYVSQGFGSLETPIIFLSKKLEY